MININILVFNEEIFVTFKILFILFACAFGFVVIISLLANYGLYLEKKEKEMRIEEIKNNIMPNWSLENAMKINRETCNYIRGDMRLSKGIYRTPEEADEYIEESLKRPLP